MHDQPVERRHPIGDGQIAGIDEPQIALRQQPQQPALLVDDDEGADAGPGHERASLGQGRPRADAVGITDDPVLRPFDLLDLTHLRLDLAGPVSAVDDADPAFLRLHDRHRRARHGIHVRGHHRTLERDAAGELTGEIDRIGVASRQDAVLRGQDEVVERAAAHQLEHRFPDPGIDGGKRRHGAMLRAFVLCATCSRA